MVLNERRQVAKQNTLRFQRVCQVLSLTVAIDMHDRAAKFAFVLHHRLQ